METVSPAMLYNADEEELAENNVLYVLDGKNGAVIDDESLQLYFGQVWAGRDTHQNPYRFTVPVEDVVDCVEHRRFPYISTAVDEQTTARRTLRGGVKISRDTGSEEKKITGDDVVISAEEWEELRQVTASHL